MRLKTFFPRTIVLCFALLATLPILAQGPMIDLHVAAASDLQPVMPIFAAEFEKETGIRVMVSYGSPAALATQIINGIPMDVFFGEDYSFPERVVAANLAEESEPVMYARGTLVLWERKDGPFQPLTLNALTDPQLKSIAIANPLNAPYGRAAVEAMQKLKLYDKAVPHFVQAENVAQAAQFAQSGNAQLAFISLTIASSDRFKQTGSFIPVPKQAYLALRQCAVIMRNAKQRDAAHKFLDYMLSSAVQSRFPALGLTPRDGK